MKKRENWQPIVEQAAEGIAVMDLDGRLTYVNNMWIRMHGFKTSEIKAETSIKLFHSSKQYIEEVVPFIEEVKKRGHKIGEVGHIHKDRSSFQTHMSVNLLKNAQGKPYALTGFAQDITKMQEAEKALANAHRQLKNVLDYSFQISIISTTPKGIIKVFNSGAEKMLGYRANEVVDKHSPLLIHLESEIAAREKELSKELGYSVKGFDVFSAKLLNGGYEEREWTYVKKNGKHLTVNLITTAVLSEKGEIRGMVGFALDITERKHSEEELKHLRNYLSNMINSMPSIIISVDSSGIITQWNKEAELCTNLRSEDATGLPLDKAIPRLADDMEKVYKSIKSRKKQSELHRTWKKNGESRHEDITVYPLISNGAEGAVIRIDDVTEQVRIQELMIQSEKMMSVGGLAAGMAHEINNPLAGMMQTARVIDNRLNLDLPANLKAAKEAGISMNDIRAYMEARDIPHMLEDIKDSGKRAADIVSNMLSFSRKSEAQPAPQNMPGLIEKTLELAKSDYNLASDFDFRKINIIRDYEKDMPLTLCEAGKIQQVLFNIMKNAAEAMHSIALKDPQFIPALIIRLLKEKDKKQIRIEIEDNGPGMDEAVRKRIFEPFFTTKSTDKGTGLGLSVSYFIITEQHNGQMRVKSTPGSGTTFIIRLPVEMHK